MSDHEDADGERTGASIEEAVEPGGGEALPDDPNRAGFSPWDEVQEAFGDARAIEVVIDEGLPTVRVPEGNDAHAPALSHESFCCIEDVSGFVVRGPWREVAAEFLPAEVTRAADARFRVRADLALERLELAVRRCKKEIDARADKPCTEKEALAALLQSWRLQNAVHTRNAIDRAAGMQQAMLAQMGAQMPADPDWVEVEPKRPACSNLVQQLLPLSDKERAMGYTKGWLKRYCSVRRTVAGAFMELTDDAMRACNVRDPIETVGLDIMGDMDVVQIKRSAERTLLPLFNAQPPPPPASAE